MMADMSAITPGQALLTHVRGILDDRWPMRGTPGCAKPPDGLRLEMHPAVWYGLLTDRAVWPGLAFSSATSEVRAVEELFGTRIRIDSKLPGASWRLVVITEEILDGGKMPEATAAQYHRRAEIVHLPGDEPLSLAG